MNEKTKELARFLNKSMPTSYVAEYLADEGLGNYTEVIEYLNSL